MTTTAVVSPPGPSALVARQPMVLRLAILALALGSFAIGTTEFVAMGLLPDIAASLHITEPIAGHVVSAYALGVVIGAPVIAAATARLPRKTVLLGLMTVFTARKPRHRAGAQLRHPGGGPIRRRTAARRVLRRRRARRRPPAGSRQASTGRRPGHVRPDRGHRHRRPGGVLAGSGLGWRAAFALVVLVGVVTLDARSCAGCPASGRPHATSPLTELGALKRPQVWLALIVGMVGFGGMFAVYTYMATTLTDVSGLPRSLVPVALMVFGSGMVAGNLIGGRMADRSVVRSLYLVIGVLAVMLALFVAAAHNPWTAMVVLFGIGASGGAIAPALQTRLMDVAADAQTLAAALNHSALNIANASGAWIGGLVIAAGFGYTAPAAAGAGLAVAGLVILTVSVLLQRRAPRTTLDEGVLQVPGTDQIFVPPVGGVEHVIYSYAPERRPAIRYRSVPSLRTGEANTLGAARSSFRTDLARWLHVDRRELPTVTEHLEAVVAEMWVRTKVGAVHRDRLEDRMFLQTLLKDGRARRMAFPPARRRVCRRRTGGRHRGTRGFRRVRAGPDGRPRTWPG